MGVGVGVVFGLLVGRTVGFAVGFTVGVTFAFTVTRPLPDAGPISASSKERNVLVRADTVALPAFSALKVRVKEKEPLAVIAGYSYQMDGPAAS